MVQQQMNDRSALGGKTPVIGAVFDLDGTLVDSAGAIAAAVNDIMAGLGVAPYELSEVAAFIGDGPDTVLRRALDRRGLAATEDVSIRFARLYEDCSVAHSELFPGIPGVLEDLRRRGYRLGLCTNKPAAATGRLLRRLEIDWMFAAVCCSDECSHRKPHPAHLLETLDRFPRSPDSAVMIGDHRNDILAANACGVPAVLAEWAASGATTDIGPDGCVVASRTSRPQDLPEILDRITGREGNFRC